MTTKPTSTISVCLKSLTGAGTAEDRQHVSRTAAPHPNLVLILNVHFRRAHSREPASLFIGNKKHKIYEEAINRAACADYGAGGNDRRRHGLNSGVRAVLPRVRKGHAEYVGGVDKRKGTRLMKRGNAYTRSLKPALRLVLVVVYQEREVT